MYHFVTAAWLQGEYAQSTITSQKGFALEFFFLSIMQSHVHLFVLHNRLQKQECRCSSAQILFCASVCLHVHVRARLCFFAHSCYFYLINHVSDKIEFTVVTLAFCVFYIFTEIKLAIYTIWKSMKKPEANPINLYYE